ncbi:rab9 effector protein with kelch motifs-like isoform X2 [Artemia franciscana]|uniref:rab9 effector protein with kelch motifs-like isoform X2 n=1 Tax=Artemia franciscana TaxID=6661 RepID=UPI0032DB571B
MDYLSSILFKIWMWFQLSEESQAILSSSRESKLPPNRWNHATAVLKNSIYLFGGRNSERIFADLWKLSLDTVSWEEILPSSKKPTALHDHSMVAWNNSLYVFGGGYLTFGPGCLWIFSTEKQHWRLVKVSNSSWPHGRRAHAATIHKDVMYVFGGYQDLRGPLNDLWLFDLHNEVWSQILTAGECPSPRQCHLFLVSGFNLYIHGGISNKKEFGDLWRLDLKIKKWRLLRQRGGPKKLHSHMGILADGFMFIFGGMKEGKYRGKSWKLKIDTLTWEKVVSPLMTPSDRASSSIHEVPKMYLPSVLEALHSPASFLQVPRIFSSLSSSVLQPRSTDRVPRVSSLPNALSSRLGIRRQSLVKRSTAEEEEDTHTFRKSLKTKESVYSLENNVNACDFKCFLLLGGVGEQECIRSSSSLSIWAALL